MGKPSPSGPSGDSMSLHTQPSYTNQPRDRYTDDDAPELQIDDLPPLYDEVAGPSGIEGAPLLPSHPLGPLSENVIAPYSRDADGTEKYLDSRLDNDPKLLEQHIYHWAETPPRQFVRLHGQHQQTEERDGKKETKWVTDFDVQVEITPYLFSDAVNRVSPKYIDTALDGDKVRRGTVFATKAAHRSDSLEGGHFLGRPTMAEWCHRYCASHAGLKCFTVERRVIGLDREKIREKFMGLIRATNYRGQFDVTFPVKDAYVHVYNDCKTNRWRATKWIWWLCALTLTFLITWPYLFFRTKRWEVVKVHWPFRNVELDGRYASISEDQFYNIWARAVYRAVFERQQRVLDQGDLAAADTAPLSFHSGLVNDTMGIFRAGIDAMNEMNRQLGWGGDR
ncbi:hypothetical protein OQA88_3009 [Cercophora sp. LCS_1]